MGADGILLHLKNVDAPLNAVLNGPAELLRLEVHAPPSEIEKLKPALGPLNCQFFNIEWGFRNSVENGSGIFSSIQLVREQLIGAANDGRLGEQCQEVMSRFP